MTWPWICLFIALWIAVIVLGVLVLGLSARIGQLQEDGAAGVVPTVVPGSQSLVGSHVPAGGEYDAWLDAGSEGTREGVVLLFVSSSCQPCARLIEQLRSYEPAKPSSPVVVVTDTEDPRHYERVPIVSRVVVDRSSAARRLGVGVTPLGVLVDRNRVVVDAAIPSGPDEIDQLATRLEERDQNADVSSAGRAERIEV